MKSVRLDKTWGGGAVNSLRISRSLARERAACATCGGEAGATWAASARVTNER